MISMDKGGGRTVHLFIPFEFKGKTVSTIVLAPVCLGHSMRWAKGDFKDSNALLVELAGVEEGVVMGVRYPDADRMMEAFISMLPPDIRQDVASGAVPPKPFPEDSMEEQPPVATTNGSGEPTENDGMMHQPGAPLPQEAGFDLSDEP